MKVASIQLDIAWKDKEENLKRAEHFIRIAKNDNCDLVIFPEMFNVGFSMNVASIAEPRNGPTTRKLCELAGRHDVNLIAGYAEQSDEKGKNVALSINRNGKVVERYVKNHPFSFANEHESYVPGTQQVVFKIDGAKCSMFICYDLRFPELFRKIAKDVEIIIVIANWPEVRQVHWESLLKARAIENQCFVVGVNRIGKDGNGLVYGGGSHVYHPLGEDLSRGGKNQEYIVTELNIAEVGSIREKFPFLQDMKGCNPSSATPFGSIG
ncbi:MAG: Predicted amidohydrolase [Candidatus Kentron sp. G]|nr:MAG: Predicted amidohydrolase [Candidatus Kentron sp. G]